MDIWINYRFISDNVNLVHDPGLTDHTYKAVSATLHPHTYDLLLKQVHELRR